MSPARRHRERIAATSAVSSPNQIVSGVGGESPAPSPQSARPDTVAAQIVLRLTHDLRRLKDIASIERKIDAKREMLPEYRAWCDGIVESGATPDGAAGEVLPTVMVWAIDTGDWPEALRLAGHVLRHDVPLPSRYQRSAPALICEEIATVALKRQAAGEPFPLDVLEAVEALTGDADMHDEIRAKLMKAIGTELARSIDGADRADPATIAAAERALAPLRRAQALHDRSGVKDRIKRLEKITAGAPSGTGSND